MPEVELSNSLVIVAVTDRYCNEAITCATSEAFARWLHHQCLGPNYHEETHFDYRA